MSLVVANEQSFAPYAGVVGLGAGISDRYHLPFFIIEFTIHDTDYHLNGNRY